MNFKNYNAKFFKNLTYNELYYELDNMLRNQCGETIERFMAEGDVTDKDEIKNDILTYLDNFIESLDRFKGSEDNSVMLHRLLYFNDESHAKDCFYNMTSSNMYWSDNLDEAKSVASKCHFYQYVVKMTAYIDYKDTDPFSSFFAVWRFGNEREIRLKLGAKIKVMIVLTDRQEKEIDRIAKELLVEDIKYI